MSATPAKSRVQQAYEVAAKGIESVKDAEIKLMAREDITHEPQDVYPTFLRQIAEYKPGYERRFGVARAELERRYHGEAALLYCARSGDGRRAGLPADVCTKIAAMNNTPVAWDNALELPRGMGFGQGEGTRAQAVPAGRPESRSSSQASISSEPGSRAQAATQRQASSSSLAGSSTHAGSPRQGGNRGLAKRLKDKCAID
ncbi:hypothetical protein EPUS_01446 [Endocarpon pusillum Z07020]|uniref:Uncharacterized protein n=1 Tax=Endocarpon pusillum (strain Z07020 / HMAS-L-300199) TaxID=1263415 RepID=U1GUI9_ENDPU|nr:uncharacterized protein EPUS_01446 [Endocarpon pusillum Z07020]ERF76113.1 hypothetical protein EPUS_01446 [Endocarpon pusillum Z07020]